MISSVTVKRFASIDITLFYMIGDSGIDSFGDKDKAQDHRAIGFCT